MIITEEKKKHLLKESKSFCMLPWVHLHVTPTGAALPCCIGSHEHILSNINDHSLGEVINSDKMVELRASMLQDIKHPACSACHRHEDQGIVSFRKTNNEMYEKYFDEALSHTDHTGLLQNFKMRYFDIRLSNICNMKCRTCNSQYSSLWEQEDLKQGRKIFNIEKNIRKSYLNEIINHIQYMNMAYFAGGEPFISEEHYIMLEEMIKQNRTDIVLRYNTNFSVLKFKDKDLLNLWSHFKNKIEVYASLDHYGKKAEYIRHGTDWAQIENNFNLLSKNKDVSLQINSVLSIFNFVTFGDFYNYLIDNKWITPKSPIYTVYNMISPVWLAALALPEKLKENGINNIKHALNRLSDMNYNQVQLTQLTDAITWVNSSHTWDEHKQKFRDEVHRIDSIRNENFTEVFPELAELLDD